MRLLSHHNKAMKFFLIIHPIGVDFLYPEFKKGFPEKSCIQLSNPMT